MKNETKDFYIYQISGIETNPFVRYHTLGIPIDELINKLQEVKEKYKNSSYTDLEVGIHEDDGLVDIDIHGIRPFNEKELYDMERIAVIARQKEKTSDGFTRDEIFFENGLDIKTLNNE